MSENMSENRPQNISENAKHAETPMQAEQAQPPHGPRGGNRAGHELATEKISKLIMRFAIPAIVSGLITATYNIVDQIFIGQYAGVQGNAATNVAFPLVAICLSLALMFGVGGASNFSLELGRGDKEKAMKMAGNTIVMLVISGLAVAAVVMLFLRPLLSFFGAQGQVMDYSITYTSITAIGMPFYIFGTGAMHLVRADGSPKYAMIGTGTGAVLNLILDPIMIFTLDMGIAGAAWATIIGQIVTAILMAWYFMRRFKTQRIRRAYLKLKGKAVRMICSLGLAACVNQLAMAVVQIAMNNTLAYYGDLSVYGRDIPLACVGVIMKVNMLFFAVNLGISQGSQPILGFNYGAGNYDRVRKTYLSAAKMVLSVSLASWLFFQLFPRQIISIFGQGSEQYFEFAIRWFRTFMALIMLNGLLPLTTNFFTSIGKATRGIVISVARNLLLMLPMVLVFPRLWGLEGMMFAGPITDLLSSTLAVVLVAREMKRMRALQ